MAVKDACGELPCLPTLAIVHRLAIMMQALATSAFAALMLMATISLAPAQNQEKGSTGWSGAPKDQPTQSLWGNVSMGINQASCSEAVVMPAR